MFSPRLLKELEGYHEALQCSSSSPAGVFLEFAALGAPGAAGGRHVVSGVGKRCKHRFDVVEHVCPKHQEGCICCVLVIERIVVTWGLGLHEVTGCAEYIAPG